MAEARRVDAAGGAGEMVTNYPQSIASHEDVSTHGETHGEGLGGRVFGRLRHLVCGLHGHDALLQFEHGRMFLRCVSCGHETPGWELNETPPNITVRGEARPIRQPQLISERRIA
jgi:hypothetical protein